MQISTQFQINSSPKENKISPKENYTIKIHKKIPPIFTDKWQLIS